MTEERSRRRWKAVALLASGVAVGMLVMAVPSTAHVAGPVGHLVQHLKKHFFTKEKAKDKFVAKHFGNFDGDDGSLVRGEGIASSQKGGGSGFYTVTFERNIQDCVLIASVSNKDDFNPDAATIGAAYFQPESTPRQAFVLIYDSFAADRVDSDFSLAALC